MTLPGYSQSSLQSTALSRTWPGALAPAGYRVGCLHRPAGAVGRCSALACPDHRSSLCLTGQSFHGVPGVRVGYESWEGCCSGSSPLSCASSAAQRSGSIKVSPVCSAPQVWQVQWTTEYCWYLGSGSYFHGNYRAAGMPSSLQALPHPQPPGRAAISMTTAQTEGTEAGMYPWAGGKAQGLLLTKSEQPPSQHWDRANVGRA